MALDSPTLDWTQCVVGERLVQIRSYLKSAANAANKAHRFFGALNNVFSFCRSGRELVFVHYRIAYQITLNGNRSLLAPICSFEHKNSKLELVSLDVFCVMGREDVCIRVHLWATPFFEHCMDHYHVCFFFFLHSTVAKADFVNFIHRQLR